MTKDEALDLALEALECFDYPAHDDDVNKIEAAITAIKQARSAPVQEPVAWINVEKRTFEWNGPVLWNTPTVAVLDKIPLYTTPPAQRQWVGLTDEEINKTPCELYAPDQGGMTMEEGLQVYARAIEAKLKEKNT